jgi:hypothetical protein
MRLTPDEQAIEVLASPHPRSPDPTPSAVFNPEKEYGYSVAWQVLYAPDAVSDLSRLDLWPVECRELEELKPIPVLPVKVADGDDAAIEKIRQWLLVDANAALPLGTRFEIRHRHITDYGRQRGMAWYRNASMAAAEEWDTAFEPYFDVAKGVWISSRHVVPPAEVTP